MIQNDTQTTQIMNAAAGSAYDYGVDRCNEIMRVAAIPNATNEMVKDIFPVPPGPADEWYLAAAWLAIDIARRFKGDGTALLALIREAELGQVWGLSPKYARMSRNTIASVFGTLLMLLNHEHEA